VDGWARAVATVGDTECMWARANRWPAEAEVWQPRDGGGNIYGYTRRPDAGISGKSPHKKVNGAQLSRNCGATALLTSRCAPPPRPPAALHLLHARTRARARAPHCDGDSGARSHCLFMILITYALFNPFPHAPAAPRPPHRPLPSPAALPAALPRPLPHLPPYTPARSRTRSTISSLEEDTLIKLHARLSICVAACMRLILVLVVGIRGVVSPLVVPHNFVLISS
jgi:hypothetical protein